MKRMTHAMGVTLLEIMLVLAIAAMVIVMSIRYYSSATTSQQTNNVVGQVQAITAAMDNLAVGSSNGYTDIKDTDVEKLVGATNMTAPWGTKYTIEGQTNTEFTIGLKGVPTGVCASLNTKIKTTTHFKTSSTCSAGELKIDYDSKL